MSSVKMFLFGGGAGYNYDIRVHNVYIQIWLEYGIINLLLYVAVLTVLAIRLFKTKFSSHNVFLFVAMIAVIIVCHYFGCLDPYSFTYYVCLLAVCSRGVNEKYSGKQKPQEEIKGDELSQANDDVSGDIVKEEK